MFHCYLLIRPPSFSHLGSHWALVPFSYSTYKMVTPLYSTVDSSPWAQRLYPLTSEWASYPWIPELSLSVLKDPVRWMSEGSPAYIVLTVISCHSPKGLLSFTCLFSEALWESLSVLTKPCSPFLPGHCGGYTSQPPCTTGGQSHMTTSGQWAGEEVRCRTSELRQWKTL